MEKQTKQVRESDFQPGIWIKCKSNKKVYKILEVVRTNDGYREMGTFYLQALDGKTYPEYYDGYGDTMRSKFDLDLAGNALYGK